MKRSHGRSVGAATTARAPDLTTTRGLVEHSQAHGELATLTAVAERGVKPGAPRQSVTSMDGIVRLTRDVPRDMRTRKQRSADERMLEWARGPFWERVMGALEVIAGDRAEEAARAIGEDRLKCIWQEANSKTERAEMLNRAVAEVLA